MLLQRFIINKFFLADPENESLAQLCACFFYMENLTYLDSSKGDKFKREVQKYGFKVATNMYESRGLIKSEVASQQE